MVGSVRAVCEPPCTMDHIAVPLAVEGAGSAPLPRQMVGFHSDSPTGESTRRYEARHEPLRRVYECPHRASFQFSNLAMRAQSAGTDGPLNRSNSPAFGQKS